MRIAVASIITLPLLLLTTCLLDMELSVPEYSLTLTSPSGFSSTNISIECSFTADENVHRCRYTITKIDGTYTEEYEDDFPAGQINQLPIDPVPGEGEYKLEFAVLTYRNGNHEILLFLVKKISFWVDFIAPDAPDVDIEGGQYPGPSLPVTISFTEATPPYESPVRLYYYILNKPTIGIWNYNSSAITPITINITEDTALRIRVIDQASNSSATIEKIYYIGTTPGTDLLARWTLDDFDGGIWSDDSGNGYDGTNRNATLFSDPDPDRGNVASFDSALPADIEITYNTAFNLEQGYTICGWYWLDSAPLNPNPTIFSKMNSAGTRRNWWIYADNSGFLTWTRTNAGVDSSLYYDIDHRDSSWHHFAAVSTSTAHILYIDGLQRAIVAATTTDTPANDLYIGSRIGTTGNKNYWDGKLDDLRIYSRGLSHVEIYEIYKGTDSSW